MNFISAAALVNSRRNKFYNDHLKVILTSNFSQLGATLHEQAIKQSFNRI